MTNINLLHVSVPVPGANLRESVRSKVYKPNTLNIYLDQLFGLVFFDQKDSLRMASTAETCRRQMFVIHCILRVSWLMN